MNARPSGVEFDTAAVSFAQVEAARRPYIPQPPRPIRTHLPQPEHDLREQLSRDRAKSECRAHGGNPDRTDPATGYPEYLEYFADAVESVDAEMVAEAMQRAA